MLSSVDFFLSSSGSFISLILISSLAYLCAASAVNVCISVVRVSSFLKHFLIIDAFLSVSPSIPPPPPLSLVLFLAVCQSTHSHTQAYTSTKIRWDINRRMKVNLISFCMKLDINAFIAIRATKIDLVPSNTKTWIQSSCLQKRISLDSKLTGTFLSELCDIIFSIWKFIVSHQFDIF